MAETILMERALGSDNPEQEVKALRAELYPETFVPLDVEDDPFADSEYAGTAPPWA